MKRNRFLKKAILIEFGIAGFLLILCVGHVPQRISSFCFMRNGFAIPMKQNSLEECGGVEEETVASQPYLAEHSQENSLLCAAGDADGTTAITEKNSGNMDGVSNTDVRAVNKESDNEDYIKWVDFDVSAAALRQAYQYDIDTYGTEQHLDWIELLAYLACIYGGDFSHYKDADMADAAEAFAREGAEKLTADMKYYGYYQEAYDAVLGGMVGEYEMDGKKYGLKAYCPIAKGFPYSHFDDFGVSRSYGYQRQHLGHDMLGQVGTPVIAVESGYVAALGWNQYGGWRIGINSFDGRRYYYYAHLRQNRPYAEGLEEGSVVTAGDVIGYMGRTGYSAKENVNNIDVSHLHYGLQLIFDESQREGNKEIWVDLYALTQFLSRHQSETVRNDETKEWSRKYPMKDPAVEKYKSKTN